MTAAAESLFANPWHRSPFYAFDTETTGVDVWEDRIVTATIARIHGPDVRVKSWLINPGTPTAPAATAVHGITNEHAAEHGQDPTDAITEIVAYITHAGTAGIPVVAFNASFDFTILQAEAERHGHGELPIPHVVDPHVIDKHIDPYRKGKRTLAATCDHYGVRQTDAHDATCDALAAARLAWALAEHHPDLVQTDLTQLHHAQTAWRSQQAESLARYLVRQGRTDDVARAWPIQERTTR